MTIEFEKRGSRAVELWSCQSVCSVWGGRIDPSASYTSAPPPAAEDAEWFNTSWPQLMAGINLSSFFGFDNSSWP